MHFRYRTDLIGIEMFHLKSPIEIRFWNIFVDTDISHG